MSQPLLEVKDLTKVYPIKRWMRAPAQVRALQGVSFQLPAQKTLAIIGESGCGKSTLARLLMQIEKPTAGEMFLSGRPVQDYAHRDYIQNIQMIFQDPLSSLNPRKKVLDILAEPLWINSDLSEREIHKTVHLNMERVGLRPEFSQRYPHMFSGGQRQRIGIARALMLKPRILICDEPVSALDISIQAQVLNLLLDLQDQEKLSYIFISHDLSVIRHLADEVAVMYLGKIVEYGTRDQIFTNPKHPYTQALMASTPQVEKSGQAQTYKALGGDLPSPLNPPSGCALHLRCPKATDVCRTSTPELKSQGQQQVSCFHV